MGTSNRQLSVVLMGVFALGATACGNLVGGGAPDEDATVSPPSTAPIASLASTDERLVSHDDFDLELSVSEGEAIDDLVTVTVRVRSVGDDLARSPFIRVDLGRDMALGESNVTCFENQSEILCAPVETTADEEDSTESHALEVAIEGVFDGDDSIVTFTAESADTQVHGDSDIANNSKTVVFIETDPPPVAPDTGTGTDADALSDFVFEPIPPQALEEDEPPADLTDLYTLDVHTDGCGVFRTGDIGDDLTWVITDSDGFQVLGRNAAGETQYRYWLAGTYSVVLETWGGDYYVEVSNTVTINC